MHALPKISKPADGALRSAGIHSLEHLTRVREAEVAALHGMGPKGLRILREALAEHGLQFKASGAVAPSRPRVPVKSAKGPSAEHKATRPTSAGPKPSEGLTRYAALLRGVSPMNCKMPELKRCLEEAGFEDVKTVLSSGNVLFSAPETDETQLERRVEDAMKQGLPRSFPVIVRTVDALRELLAADPYQAFALAPSSKRVVTFLRKAPHPKPKLPIERDDAHILVVRDREVFSAYVPTGTGPVFMQLIESTFTKDVTTRTWDTVAKLAR